MTSADGGKSWGAPKIVATAQGKVDYPFLMPLKNQPILGWNTQENGLQIIKLSH
jgi:hypothetical protein